MVWQVEFHSHFSDSDYLESCLADLGIESISYLPSDQSDYQLLPGDSPAWQDCRVQLILENDQQLDRLMLAVQSRIIDRLSPQDLQLSSIDNEDWQTSWQKHWKPTRFGKLVVCSHLVADPEYNSDDKPVYINPGLAFGTGTHETTALCLDWISNQSLAHHKVLDYGSGSGILALAAVAMGSKEVVAYDHDPQAVLASKQNNSLNDGHRFLTVVDSNEAVVQQGTFDIILANIMLIPLLSLVETFRLLLKDTGRIVVSGILASQKEQLLAVWNKSFKVQNCQHKNEWLMLSFVSNDNDTRFVD